jgi:DNA-binding LacI/PurR family transcriptional regulator
MARERRRGVADACAAAGLGRPVILTTDLDIGSAARAVAGWLSRSVTGVCAYNDETAIAVLAGLREHGLAAPADLAVIGVDDIPIAALTAPPLTTIAFDLQEAGRDLAEAVLARLAGEQPQLIWLSSRPHVVPRSST